MYRPRGKFVDPAPYCVNNAAAGCDAASIYQKKVHELSSTSVYLLYQFNGRKPPPHTSDLPPFTRVLCLNYSWSAHSLATSRLSTLNSAQEGEKSWKSCLLAPLMTPLASWSLIHFKKFKIVLSSIAAWRWNFYYGCVVKEIGQWIWSEPSLCVRVCCTLLCATLSKLSYTTAPNCLESIYCYCKGDSYYRYKLLHGCTKRFVLGSENSAYTCVCCQGV